MTPQQVERFNALVDRVSVPPHGALAGGPRWRRRRMTRRVLSFLDTFGRLVMCTRDIRRAARMRPCGTWVLYRATPDARDVSEVGRTTVEAQAASWVAEGALP